MGKGLRAGRVQLHGSVKTAGRHRLYEVNSNVTELHSLKLRLVKSNRIWILFTAIALWWVPRSRIK